MNYKTGETPQIDDEISGQVDGLPARGRVRAVRENGDVLITRRAAYAGKDKPLASEGVEVPADGLTLVYRHISKATAPAAKPAKATKKAASSGAAAK